MAKQLALLEGGVEHAAVVRVGLKEAVGARLAPFLLAGLVGLLRQGREGSMKRFLATTSLATLMAGGIAPGIDTAFAQPAGAGMQEPYGRTDDRGDTDLGWLGLLGLSGLFGLKRRREHDTRTTEMR